MLSLCISESSSLQPDLRRIASHTATCLHSPSRMRHCTHGFSRFVLQPRSVRIRFERLWNAEQRARILPTRTTSALCSTSLIPHYNLSDSRTRIRAILVGRRSGSMKDRDIIERIKWMWMFPLMELVWSIVLYECGEKDRWCGYTNVTECIE